MRGETEMLESILDVARRDERISAVILNGSRANPNAKKDAFQDFDIVYFVRRLETFTADHDWIDAFGERIILQMPDAMRLPGEGAAEYVTFAYLMLFTDGNRLDLTLFPVEKIETHFLPDSLSVLLLDKEGVFGAIAPPAESDYLIKKPSEKEFADVSNEFWWLLPYVAKGLRRGEIIYAKDILENPVRKMFLQMIEWHIGVKTGFSVNFGKSGKFAARHLDAGFYAKILQTYADAEAENIWKSLFLISEIFEETARSVASALRFDDNAEESENVIKYLKKVKKGEN